MLSVRPYVAADAPAWDAVVERSRNGNLLHRRGYMDYHADRFTDASLVIEKAGEMVAVLPANIDGAYVTSHGGLTYAGLISTRALRAVATLEVFERIGAHFRAQGVTRLIYKAVPHVFQAYPAEEDLYALHRLGARLHRRDLSSVIALQGVFHFTEERRRAIQRARRSGLTMTSGGDLAAFHALLSHVLAAHDAAPTHSLDELRLLKSRFPGHIVLHEVRDNDELLAAALVYDLGPAVHTQYLAASDEGRRRQALSLLLGDLIEVVYAHKRHFSFGISTEQAGMVLNNGLVEQKERFGARSVVHDFYTWDIA
ncbi:GNAT family N-acetyltransferase [Luteibacter anthropi]|uniref:GNAT family N-acetyltransferase n=1 Tax=Luteibacter anthropi TaxID=564369 RepID=UPI0020325245|nr:GNAT family N-acetyltransferase [Luteibacter anthropi]URX61802.1 GNAT family N-acetyltransferase [Luteibacter anthropi]